ncbi:hypothetical protein SPRG_17683 [Saprolegnia parasitica CBS 223.65]|uniref:Uncharacterized protein n=1 Tax=Saprolegnia parasitica (strain CBS 223.65) TaxID=695850 RepID=A0A067BFD1_SAPPC|nr:hypothetical protein SPRG_17683 [Saprolegnia parasitica CBS 223.65]KDO16833.1 hypothetical protein SPRG_17683 [Saprolegnia parasitica CBS 223.65]|eukprot:XP_012212460.1 hypothetical protein SPRG_17683 [Saprolegnia parasitica CBS 223.65]
MTHPLRPARGLYRLRTALQIFRSLTRDSVRPATFFGHAQETIDLYIRVCPRAGSELLGRATTLTLNSQVAYEKALREVNAWCYQATAYLGFGRDAVGSTDDYATDVSHVIKAMCEGGVSAMQSVAVAFQSCARDLSASSAIFHQLAAMHDSSEAIQLRSHHSPPTFYGRDGDDPALARALRTHANRIDGIDGVVQRMQQAIKQLQETQVIALLDAFLRRPLALHQLDTRTMNDLLYAADSLVNECRLFMNEYEQTI